MKLNFITITLTLISAGLVGLLSATVLGLYTLDFIPAGLEILNLPSILLVLSGVGLVTCITFPPQVIRRSIPYLFAFFSHSRINRSSLDIDVDRILNWQQQIKLNKYKSRNELAETLTNTYEGYLFGLLSTNYSPDQLRRMGVVKARNKFREMQKITELFETMANYAPAFGMLGTLIGLIKMLGNFDNITELGVGLSFALMTTFYGILLANALFSPIAGKIMTAAENEYQRNLMMLEGILMIQQNEPPMLVYDMLNSNNGDFQLGSLPFEDTDADVNRGGNTGDAA